VSIQPAPVPLPQPPRIEPRAIAPVAPRPWYAEPTKVAIAIVLCLVAVGFLILLVTAAS
jgi:hypothetical protein